MGWLPRKAATPRISSPGADHPYSSWGLTFVLGSEFAHLSWESLVELVFPWDQRLAQGRLVEAEHTRVPPNLVDKGLQQDALGTGLHVHSPESWAHPPGAGGREKGEEAGSSGQRVLRLPSVCASVCLATAPQLRGTGRSAASTLSRGASVLLFLFHQDGGSRTEPRPPRLAPGDRLYWLTPGARLRIGQPEKRCC